MKGIDITGPPSLPRPFVVKKGGEADIIVDSDGDSESDDDMSVDELNTARIEDNDDLSNNNAKKDTLEVVSFGDIYETETRTIF